MNNQSREQRAASNQPEEAAGIFGGNSGVAQQAWQRDENQAWPQDARPVRPVTTGNEPRASDASPVRLTSRGAVLLMICVFALGFLLASLFGAMVLAGLAFVLGTAAAARYTKAADLLTVAVSPPLVFFCVLVCVKAVTGSGNLLISILEGCALALAGLAPWLFIGVVVNLVIAWVRGLPRCIADLRRSLSPAAALAREAGSLITAASEQPPATERRGTLPRR